MAAMATVVDWARLRQEASDLPCQEAPPARPVRPAAMGLEDFRRLPLEALQALVLRGPIHRAQQVPWVLQALAEAEARAASQR